MTALDDPEHVRHKVLFDNGILYDFIADTFRPGTRADRMSRRCPHAFKEPSWTPELEAKIFKENGFFKNLAKFEHHAKGKTLDEVAHNGGVHNYLLRCLQIRIYALMDTIAEEDEFFAFLLKWTKSKDEFIVWMKWMARGMSAHPRFCEAVWLVGAAQGGKDIIIALIQTWGGLDTGYCAPLSYGYVTKKNTRTEGCAPFLRACAGARFVFVSEIPNERISMSLLKPLCEQRGATLPVPLFSLQSKKIYYRCIIYFFTCYCWCF